MMKADDLSASDNLEKYLTLLEKKLQTEVKKLREALEFYGKGAHWQDMRPDFTEYYKEGEAIYYLDNDTEMVLCEGGKRARQTLKDLYGEVRDE